MGHHRSILVRWTCTQWGSHRRKSISFNSPALPQADSHYYNYLPMNQASVKAGQLACTLLKRRGFAHPLSVGRATSTRLVHTTRTKPIENPLNLRSTISRHKSHPKTPPQRVRYCSCQRAMCKGLDATGGATKVKSREILPANVKPLHYDLTLEPNFGDFTYEGTVIIE